MPTVHVPAGDAQGDPQLAVQSYSNATQTYMSHTPDKALLPISDMPVTREREFSLPAEQPFR